MSQNVLMLAHYHPEHLICLRPQADTAAARESPAVREEMEAGRLHSSSLRYAPAFYDRRGLLELCKVGAVSLEVPLHIGRRNRPRSGG